MFFFLSRFFNRSLKCTPPDPITIIIRRVIVIIIHFWNVINRRNTQLRYCLAPCVVENCVLTWLPLHCSKLTILFLRPVPTADPRLKEKPSVRYTLLLFTLLIAHHNHVLFQILRNYTIWKPHIAQSLLYAGICAAQWFFFIYMHLV